MFFYREKAPINVCFYMPEKIKKNQVNVKCVNKSLRNCLSLRYLKSVKYSYNYNITDKNETHGDKVINVTKVHKSTDSFFDVFIMEMIGDICSKCKKCRQK